MSFKNSNPRPAPVAALLAALLAACSGKGPSLDALTIGDGKAYAAVGVQQQLTLTGQFSDGSTAQVKSDVTWASSDPATVAVDAAGVLTPWVKGTARITATHRGTGLSATVDVLSRLFVPVPAGAGAPTAGRVDTDFAFFHVSGLTPGVMYTPALFDMSDDVDLSVYSDISMAPETRLCSSLGVGVVEDWCTAPAGPEGELWVAVDGQWTRSGATFSIEASLTPAVELASTLAFPDALPVTRSVGATRQYLRITGLAPGAAYEVRLSGLTADLDLEVYGDAYEYASLCESFLDGTVDDACDALAGTTGELFVEIDGETSQEGGDYTLALTAR